MSLVAEMLRPQFPFWTMMSISLSFLLALGIYHLALQVTAGRLRASGVCDSPLLPFSTKRGSTRSDPGVSIPVA
jgi:hypothetical protein